MQELDIEQPQQLADYLRRSGRIAKDESPKISLLSGGVSNRTVLVERESGEAWVLKQALAKLRVKVDWFSDRARIQREALGLRWLREFAPHDAITPLIFLDPSQHLLAMAAVAVPHENWKSMLLAGRLQLDHVHQFATLLAMIHRGAHKRAAEVAPVFEDRSFFESLRVEPYYQFSAQQVPDAAPFMNQLIAQTRERRVTLVHGDYSPKNILIHDDRLVLLDHEVIHFGEPAFDLGFAMTHLLSKAHHLADQRAQFAEAARLFWLTYRIELGGVSFAGDLEPIAVRHTLGCLLARVAGRSPLEYLDESERARQRDAVIALMRDPPQLVPSMIERFLSEL